jgi:hypothetical protein
MPLPDLSYAVCWTWPASLSEEVLHPEIIRKWTEAYLPKVVQAVVKTPFRRPSAVSVAAFPKGLTV